jgi:hypothetical protein
VWGSGIDSKLGITAKSTATQLLTNDGYLSLSANQSIASSTVNADKSLTLLVAEKTNGVTTAIKQMSFDVDGRQVGETQTTSMSSLGDVVQAEYKYKLDFNGDKKIGFAVTSKVSPSSKTIKYAVYSMTNNGQTIAAFAPEGGKPGSTLSSTTSLILKNADGTPFVMPNLTSYGYSFSTLGGAFNSVILSLNGQSYTFGADGKLTS